MREGRLVPLALRKTGSLRRPDGSALSQPGGRDSTGSLRAGHQNRPAPEASARKAALVV